MKCWKCGNELIPGARFCTACGTDQQSQPRHQEEQPQQSWPPRQEEPQQQNWQPQDWQKAPPPPPPPPRSPNGGIPGAGGDDTALKIFAGVCALLYGVTAVRGVMGLLRTLFSFFHFSSLLNLAVGLGLVVLNVCVCLILVMFITKRTPGNSDGLLILLGLGAVGTVALRLVSLVVHVLFARYAVGTYVGSFFLTALGGAATVAGVYAILRYVMGEFPLVGKSQDELQREVQETLNSLGKTATEAAQGAKASWDANQQARRDQQAQQWQSQPVPPMPGGYGVTRLKTDRSLLMYIILTFLTCGLYSFYFIYSLAQDVNTACNGDGKQTAGLLKFLLLSFLTCGFYAFFWYYSLGNRLADNAPRYGMQFQENGTTILLWLVLGSLLCGIGSFVAMHIIIKNTNTICGAYNYRHGM